MVLPNDYDILTPFSVFDKKKRSLRRLDVKCPVCSTPTMVVTKSTSYVTCNNCQTVYYPKYCSPRLPENSTFRKKD